MIARMRTPGAFRLVVLATVTALLAMLGMAVLGANAAHAAGRVDVSPAPNADGSTTVTLSGSGFQYVPNAPGGIYVTFGVVQDPTTNSWAPSQGGRSGSTFGYASTGGATLLVAFAGGSSAGESNAVIDENGNWTAQMTIPGARFPSSSGNPHAGQAQEGAEIDCLTVQCGIITFGAHGMVNANNESFTPVSFATADGELVSGSGGQSFTDEATQLEIPANGEAGEDGAAKTDATTGEQADAQQHAGAAAAATPAAPAQAETADASGLSSSALVLGVLGFALLVLIGAVVYAIVRRSRGAKAAAGLPAAAPQQAPQEPQQQASAHDTDSAATTKEGMQ